MNLTNNIVTHYFRQRSTIGSFSATVGLLVRFRKKHHHRICRASTQRGIDVLSWPGHGQSRERSPISVLTWLDVE